MLASIVPAVMVFMYIIVSSCCAAWRQVNVTDEACSTMAASHCLTYSARFQELLTPEEQSPECVNASRSKRCLERMLSGCRTLSVTDRELYDHLVDALENLREELSVVCNAMSRLCATSYILLNASFIPLMMIKSFIII